MVWFKKTKAKQEAIVETERLEQAVTVELKLHTKATDKSVAKAKEVTTQFNKLIKQNGFTLIIQSAAGGKK